MKKYEPLARAVLARWLLDRLSAYGRMAKWPVGFPVALGAVLVATADGWIRILGGVLVFFGIIAGLVLFIGRLIRPPDDYSFHRHLCFSGRLRPQQRRRRGDP